MLTLDVIAVEQCDFAINYQELGVESPKQDSMEIDDFEIKTRDFILFRQVDGRPLVGCDRSVRVP